MYPTNLSFQPAGYNIGWHLLFQNWCKAIKGLFLFPVPRFHLCQKSTPPQIMDSFFSLSKFELEMKIDICISAKLAFKLCYSGGGVKDFKQKNCIICLVCKRAEKIDYLKYIVAYLCSINNEYSISIHLFYGWF